MIGSVPSYAITFGVGAFVALVAGGVAAWAVAGWLKGKALRFTGAWAAGWLAIGVVAYVVASIYHGMWLDYQRNHR